MLNWALLKNPLNWLIVMFMLIIAGFVVDIVVLKFSSKGQQVNETGLA